MIKVLLVDDEPLICKGISTMVPWASNGYKLIGTASNGKRALEYMQTEVPDIVLADIRMPEMDGIALVQAAFEQGMSSRFILLTGFRDFEYANIAMQYGVKHYILKPANVDEILAAMNATKAEILDQRQRNEMIDKLNESMKQISPHALERFLSHYILNGMCTEADLAYFSDLLQNSSGQYRMVAMLLDGTVDYMNQLSLQYICREFFEAYGPYADTIVNDIVVLITPIQHLDKLTDILQEVRHNYQQYLKHHFSISISHPFVFSDIPAAYRECVRYLSYRFFFDEEAVLTPTLSGLYEHRQNASFTLRLTEADAEAMVKNKALGMEKMKLVFRDMEECRLPIDQIHNYILQCYLILSRYVQDGFQMDSDLVNQIMRLDSLQQAYQFFESYLLKSENRFIKESSAVQNRLVERIKQIVEEYLDNPDLNLKWIAKEKLFMREDYLSKVFSQQAGVRFTRYVTNRRIETATRLIQEDPNIKAYELAEKIGFRGNVPYLSTVFKNELGINLSEYKKYLRGEPDIPLGMR